ncbi:MAG: transporter substrate-binding domain-containing protein [Treponema sp.]|nr:transporter substrate-binding domain-containing protein [Treponema sp.]
MNIKRIPLLVLCAIAICATGCLREKDKIADTELFKTYSDIPGITAQEISDIEAIKEKYDTFIYGMTMSTEAFVSENIVGGENAVGGYAGIFCEWLTGLFGIRFQPKIYAWSDLVEKLGKGEVDFAGNITPTEERQKIYYMTDPVAERQFKTIQIAGSPSLDRIALTRPVRYAFIEGAAIAATVASVTDSSAYESVFVSNYEEAYLTLESGRADAFIGDSAVMFSFAAYDNVYIADFLPLIFSPVSMATANAELASVISAITKAQRNGAMPYLNNLYNKGYEEYKRHRFFMHLNEEEKAYLRNTFTVPLVAQYFNYPLVFYNAYDEKWDGISFDLLHEIEKLSGLNFEVINDEHTEMPELMAMLSDGRGHIFTDLIFTKEREPHFIWNNNKYMADQYALLSKIDYPNVSLNEIPYKRIALIGSTAHKEMFRVWFPGAVNVIEYINIDEAFLALEEDKADLVMAAKTKLLYYLNYFEFSGYKANFLFNHYYESAFAFNKDQTILCSIVDKAIPLLETNVIVEQWVTKTFDYRYKIIEARFPWLIGATILSFIIIVLVLVMFYRNRKNGKRLEKLIAEVSEANRVKNISINVMENVLNGIDAMIYVSDPTTDEILFMNDYMKRQYSIGDDCVGQLCYKILQKNKDRRCDFCPCIELAREPDKTVVWEARSSATKQIYHNTDRYISWPNGKTVHIQHSIDMTELLAAKESAERSSRYKSDFLATVSHEIRTPMNAILGITEIQLQNEKLPQDTQEALAKIYDSGYLLLGIINDILDLSKIEAGKFEITPVNYDVASMINDTIHLNIMRFDSKPIEFELQLDEKIPSILFGDELRIKQILNNLLSNAFKYTDKGKVSLSVSAEYTSQWDDAQVTLVFNVKDTGQGMTEEQVNRLFTEYTRFHTEANRMVEGTGLGLNITKKLIYMMNGKISVESEPEKGSVFTVRLPQGFVSSGVLGKELAENFGKFHFGLKTHLKRSPQIIREYMPYGSVLIVDDVETNLYVAKGLMAPYGLKIDTLESGFLAVEKIKGGESYDVIFMDHFMPEMDGIETVKIIRDMGYMRPIVALTANALSGQAEMFIANGFDDFISKPIDIRQLNVVLNKLVRDKQPPEVIETARKQGHKPAVDGANNLPRSIEPQIMEIFIRDAKKAVNALSVMYNKNTYKNEDIHAYTINVHSMKSALAVIGEKELSDIAHRLEDAGRESNIAVLSEKTPAFLEKLKAVIEKVVSKKNGVNGETTVENSNDDRTYLREKLAEVQAACSALDKKAAKDIISELEQKIWSRPVKNLLDIVSEHLLHSDFEEAVAATKGIDKI